MSISPYWRPRGATGELGAGGSVLTLACSRPASEVHVHCCTARLRVRLSAVAPAGFPDHLHTKGGTDLAAWEEISRQHRCPPCLFAGTDHAVGLGLTGSATQFRLSSAPFSPLLSRTDLEFCLSGSLVPTAGSWLQATQSLKSMHTTRGQKNMGRNNFEKA